MRLQQKPGYTGMPDISVIITTHNRCKLLPRALESVLKQSRPADEIIIVDDASSDDTSAWLKQQEHACTVLTLPQQQGVSAARNAAIRHANGEWLAFLDDDDSWLPDKLEQQLRKYKEKVQERHRNPDVRRMPAESEVEVEE